MDVFWDTSGLVATLLQEPGTAEATRAWSQTTRAWAWRWLKIETESALGRRHAPQAAWVQWRQMSAGFRWLDFDPGEYPALCSFNRALRLRAADAGHLFVCDRAAGVIPNLALFTQDSEMAAAAAQVGLPLLRP